MADFEEQLSDEEKVYDYLFRLPDLSSLVCYKYMYTFYTLMNMSYTLLCVMDVLKSIKSAMKSVLRKLAG